MGRPNRAVAAWTLFIFVAILAIGLGLSVGQSETIDCSPRLPGPNATELAPGTINPGHHREWSPRIDPSEWNDEEDAAGMDDHLARQPQIRPLPNIRC